MEPTKNGEKRFGRLWLLVAFSLPIGGVLCRAPASPRLHGEPAREAVARALRTFAGQFRKIGSIHFSATVRVGARPAIPMKLKYLRLLGRYRFWAQREHYRIGWRIIRSNYAPLIHQIWAFNGRRYEVSIGVPNTLIYITHHRIIHGSGPAQSNVLLASIFFLCNRRGRREPGNWLDWRQVRRHPRRVAELGTDRVVRWFEYTPTGAKFAFCIKSPFLRYAARRSDRPPAQGVSRRGRYIQFEMVLRRRGGVYLPVDQFPLPAARSKGGIRDDRRFSYRRSRVKGGYVRLLVGEKIFKGGKWHRRIKVTKLVVDGRINPARFSINPTLAPGYIEDGRIITTAGQNPPPTRGRHSVPTK